MIVAALGLVLLAGCMSGTPDAIHVAGTGLKISTLAEFKPETMPGKEALLVMGGNKLPVTVRELRTGEQVRFDFMAHGQALDTERYGFSPQRFTLLEANSETYDPPIELLRFPMNVGDTWNWKGVLVSGDRSHSATAIILTSVDGPIEGVSGTESVKVEVKLSIDSGAAKPAERALNFWFIPGQGVLSRKFGFASERIPPGKKE